MDLPCFRFVFATGFALIVTSAFPALFDYDVLRDGDVSKLPDRTITVAGNEVTYKAYGDILFSPDEVQNKAMLGQLWPNGKLLIAFDASVDQDDQQQFWSACHLWEPDTGIKCTQRTTEKGYIVVKAVNSDGLYAGRSVVGYHPSPQAMEIANWDQQTLVHEIGHALGKAHEHQRSDAAQYLDIHLEHAIDGTKYNLTPIASTRNLGAPMDFDSVMFYFTNAFSSDGQATIVLKEAYRQYQDTIGHNAVPSANDLLDIRKSYKP